MKKVVVLRESGIRDEFHEFAESQGWILTGHRDADVETQEPFQTAWRTADGRASIHYIEEPPGDGTQNPMLRLENPYLVLEGSGLESLESRIARSFGRFLIEELVERIENSIEVAEKVNAILCLNQLLPDEFDEACFAVLEDCLSSASEDVRLAATMSVSLTRWPQRLSILRRMQDDPSHEVGEMAYWAEQTDDHEGESFLIDVWTNVAPSDERRSDLEGAEQE